MLEGPVLNRGSYPCNCVCLQSECNCRPKLHFSDYHLVMYLQTLILHFLTEESCKEIRQKRWKKALHIFTFLIITSDAQGTKQNHREPPLSAEITLRRSVVKAHGGFTIKLTKKTHSCFRCHSYHIIFLDFYFFSCNSVHSLH